MVYFKDEIINNKDLLKHLTISNYVIPPEHKNILDKMLLDAIPKWARYEKGNNQ